MAIGVDRKDSTRFSRLILYIFSTLIIYGKWEQANQLDITGNSSKMEFNRFRGKAASSQMNFALSSSFILSGINQRIFKHYCRFKREEDEYRIKYRDFDDQNFIDGSQTKAHLLGGSNTMNTIQPINTHQQFFLIYNTLFPLSNSSLNQFTTSSPTISFTPVRRTFIVPSKLHSVPLKNVSLSLSFTSTGLPSSCLMKSDGLPLRLMNYYKVNSLVIYTQMLGTLIETILLLINAIAILNEKRFLKKYGFHTEAAQGTNQNEVLTSKSQAIMMIFTLRSVGRYVLIPLNVLAIVFEVLG